MFLLRIACCMLHVPAAYRMLHATLRCLAARRARPSKANHATAAYSVGRLRLDVSTGNGHARARSIVCERRT
jgi:hypothetical protein